MDKEKQVLALLEIKKAISAQQYVYFNMKKKYRKALEKFVFGVAPVNIELPVN